MIRLIFNTLRRTSLLAQSELCWIGSRVMGQIEKRIALSAGASRRDRLVVTATVTKTVMTRAIQLQLRYSDLNHSTHNLGWSI